MKLLFVARIVARIVLALVGMGGVVVASQLVPGCGPEPLERTALVGIPVPVRKGVAVAESGRVLRVVDGDTYDVLLPGGVVRLRLLGVDAPEHDQAFGAQATDSVKRLLAGQAVAVVRGEKDLYGRTLGSVRVAVPAGKGITGSVAVDSLLVVRGWAWASDPTHNGNRLADEEARARKAGRGLWKCGTAGAVPPKIWRGFNAQYKRRYGVGCTW